MNDTLLELKDDLLNFLRHEGLTINSNTLTIILSAEELCYQRNINFFPSDMLLPIINYYPVFAEIIDRYGGSSLTAIQFLNSFLDKEKNQENRDKYYINNYSSREWNNYRNIIIEKCIKRATEDSRLEINEIDLIFSILDNYDDEFPLTHNSTWIDERFHTPYNTLSHIVGRYSEDLWVKSDDVRLELTRPPFIEYDLAISFAGKDRQIAKDIAQKIARAGRRVFYDDYEKANLWGKDLYTYLSDIYGNKSKYCLMIVSQSYASEQWPNLERQAAQSKALKEKYEYILPLRLDDTEIPGLLPTIGYIDIKSTDINEVVNLIIEKISS